MCTVKGELGEKQVELGRWESNSSAQIQKDCALG